MGIIQLSELSEKHCSRKITGDVIQICEPLRAYGITYFMYSRFFNDGTGYCLSENWDAFYHHSKKQYSIGPVIPKKIASNKFFFLPGDVKDRSFNPVFHDWLHMFNTTHFICFVEHHADYIDRIIYGSIPENTNTINFYLNNIDFLEKFKFYFRDKASKLIIQSDENRILLPLNMRQNFQNAKNNSEATSNKGKIHQQLKTNRYILSGKYDNIAITKRELEMVKYIAKGYTYKEIANSINISPRTVEHYLENIKIKLKLQKKSEIIELLTEFNLL